MENWDKDTSQWYFVKTLSLIPPQTVFLNNHGSVYKTPVVGVSPLKKKMETSSISSLGTFLFSSVFVAAFFSQCFANLGASIREIT